MIVLSLGYMAINSLGASRRGKKKKKQHTRPQTNKNLKKIHTSNKKCPYENKQPIQLVNDQNQQNMF